MTQVDSPAVRSPLEGLLLVRLAVAPGKPPSAADVSADVAKVTGTPVTVDQYAGLTARRAPPAASGEGIGSPRQQSRRAQVSLTRSR
jgi:hypothetical protein